VSPGQLIQAGSTVCFMLSDVSTVWVQGHIFDRDLPDVRVGAAVEETNPASGRVFHGMVGYVGAFVDAATRTTPVRIVTQNPEGLLKKDMFVEALIHTSGAKNLLAVPVSAVLRDDKNEPIVYVQMQPGKFAQRSVTIGAQQDGRIAIAGNCRGPRSYAPLPAAAAALAALFRGTKRRTRAMAIRTMPNVHTMVAPVGRSICSERYTPSAETSVPMVQPMARRGPILSAKSMPPTEGTIR